MIENRIRDVAAHIHANRAITMDDVELLSDLTLPGGFVHREEVAELLRLERHVKTRHESWQRFFIDTVAAHLAWERRPIAVVGREDAEWLIIRLGLASTGHTANSMGLLETLLREGVELDQSLVATMATALLRAA